MRGFLSWIATSGVVQGVIIGATLAYLTAVTLLDAVARRHTTTSHGWRAIRQAGQPGNGIVLRAALQKALPVVNVFEEAAYWTTDVDDSGEKLRGEHRYRLHFPAGATPPNDAFWSLTATDTAGYMVNTRAGRSSVDDHSGLVVNPDGSVDVLIQNAAPSAPSQNWLPVPPRRFKLMMRAYLPRPAIVTGAYELPAVERMR